jgi:signal transduction histidine kinase
MSLAMSYHPQMNLTAIARLCFVLLLFYAAAMSAPCQAGDLVFKLDQAEFILDESEVPPPDSAPWKPQPLPDNWSVSRPQASGFGWYRIRFVVPEQPSELYAVYVAKIAVNGAFYINGQLLGSGGPFPPATVFRGGSMFAPVTIGRNANRPQFFVIPSRLLKSGGNVLHVRMWGVANVGCGLGVARVGPEAELRAPFERRFFFQVQLQQISVALIGFVAALMLFLWMRRPKDTMYGYLGLSCLGGAGFAGLYVVRDAPLPGAWWDAFCFTAGSCCVAFFGIFLLRFIGQRRKRLEAWLWLYMAISPLIVVLGGMEQHYLALRILGSLNWFFLAVFLVILVQAWRQRREAGMFLVLAVLAVDVLLPLYDFAISLGSAPFEWMYLAPYASALGSIFIGGLLINRFVRNLNGFERLNVELEGRVAQKHAELEQNYQHMQQLERQSAIVEERQRIMRDMHDGLGAQLISTLSLVEHGDLAKDQIAAVLRECLDDLRLTIDSLESTENDLLTVLGNFRYRLEPRLNSHGIQLDWQVRDLPKLACLTPQNVLHILRILQEAFTNILKHARAGRVSVETGVASSSPQVFVRVCDNGVGFTGNRKGHGLANMKRRAEALGGALELVTSTTGTVVTLLLPSA